MNYSNYNKITIRIVNYNYNYNYNDQYYILYKF